MPQPLPGPELARLSALYRYDIVDTGAEPEFDEVVGHVADLLHVPVVRLVFADAHRFWVKASAGTADREMARSGSIVDALVLDQPALTVADALDPACRAGLLEGAPGLRAFAGVRLATEGDEALGALYVADTQVRSFSDDELAFLAGERDRALVLLESRRRLHLDAATGAMRRDAFLQQIDRMIAASLGAERPLSLLQIDLGGFRSNLDATRAGLGSLLMQRMSDLGREQVRHRDTFGRIDDAVFAILLTDTDGAGADVLGRRLLANLRQGWEALMPVLELGDVAWGCATLQAGEAGAASSFLAAAQTACSAARACGPASLVA